MRTWLIELRNERNLTQAAVAQSLGITQAYYSEIENGNKQKDMSLDMAVKLANLFNVPSTRIIDLETGR